MGLEPSEEHQPSLVPTPSKEAKQIGKDRKTLLVVKLLTCFVCLLTEQVNQVLIVKTYKRDAPMFLPCSCYERSI